MSDEVFGGTQEPFPDPGTEETYESFKRNAIAKRRAREEAAGPSVEESIGLGRQKLLDQQDDMDQRIAEEEALKAQDIPMGNGPSLGAGAPPGRDSMGHGGTTDENRIRKNMGPVVREVVDFPAHVVAGLFDVPQEAQSAMLDVEKSLEDIGFPTGIYWNGDEITFSRPYDARTSFTNQFIDLIPSAGPESYHHPVRSMARWLGGFIVTQKVTKLFGLPKALATIGRTEGVITPGVMAAGGVTNAALTAMWAQAEDADLLVLLDYAGVERGEFLKSIEFNEDNTPMYNRINNGLKDIPLQGVSAVALKAMRMIGAARFAIAKLKRDAPEVFAELDLRGPTAAAKAKWDEMAEILGDPTAKVRIRKAGATKTGSDLPKSDQVGAAPLSDITDVADDMATSLAGRRREAVSILSTEELSKRINYSVINTGDDVHLLMSDLMEGFYEEDIRASIPRQPRSAIAKEASEIDIIDQLVIARKATNPNLPPLTPAELHAARQLQAALSQTVERIGALYKNNPTDGKLAAFIHVTNIYREVQRQVKAGIASATRAFGALNMPVTGEGHILVSEMDRIISEAGTDTGARQLALAVAQAAERGDHHTVDTLVSGLHTISGKVAGAVRTYYYFAMLSRLATQAHNTVASTLFFVAKGLEVGVATQLGRAFGTHGTPSGGMAAWFSGGVGGLMDGLRIPHIAKLWKEVALGEVDDFAKAGAEAIDGGAFKAFRTNTSGYGIGKVDKTVAGGFSREAWGLPEAANLNLAYKTLDLALRPLDLSLSTAQRGLVASDEVLKTMFHRAEGRLLAQAQAMHELESGIIQPHEVASRFQYLARHPSGPTQANQLAAAQEGAFLTHQTGYVSKFFKGMADLPVLGRMLMPFRTVPQNVAIQELLRTPLGAVMPTFWNDLRSTNPMVVERAWARFLVGNSMLAGVISMFSYAKSIRLVGSTPDWQQREQWGRLQRGEETIQIATRVNGFDTGDFVSIPFKGFEPVSFTLSLGANFLRMLDSDEFDNDDVDHQQLVLGLGAAMAVSMMSPSMVSSMSDFMTAMDDPEDPTTGLASYAERTIATLAAPGASAQFVNSMDPVYRESFGLLDTIVSRTPGMSENLPYSRDMWGRIRQKEPFAGLHTTVVMHEMVEPIDLWLENTAQVNMTRPSKTAAQFRPGIKVKWKDYPELYSDFLELQGQKITDPQELISVQIANANFAANINAPSGWVPSGRGLLGEMNALVSGYHPYMQDHWDDKDVEGQLNFMGQAISYYRKAALEELLMNPDNADLFHEVDRKSLKALETEDDPLRRARLSLF